MPSDTTNPKKKFLGVILVEGVTKINFSALIILACLCMIMTTMSPLLQPLFLDQVIKIAPEKTGRINANLLVLASIATIIFSGYFGRLSDRYGRKKVMSFGFVSTALTLIIFGYIKEISSFLNLPVMPLLVIARFLLSATVACYLALFLPSVAEYTLIQTRGRAMAAYGLLMAFGVMFTNVFFAQLPKYMTLPKIFALGAAVSLLSAMITKKGLVDKSGKEIKTDLKVKIREVLSVLRKSHGLQVAYAAAFTSKTEMMLLASFLMMWIVRVVKQYNMTPAQGTAIGGMTLGIFALMSVISKPLWGIIVDKMGRIPGIVLGLICCVIGNLAVGLFITNPFSLEMKLYIALIGFGVSGDMTGSRTLTADMSPKKMLGAIMGGYIMVSTLGSLAFMFIGGYLFDYVSYASPFTMIGLADLVVVVWALLIRNKVPKITTLAAQETAEFS